MLRALTRARLAPVRVAHLRAAPLCSAAALPLGAPTAPRRIKAKGEPRYTVQDVVGWLEDEHAFDLCFLDVKELMDGAVGDWLLFASARRLDSSVRLVVSAPQQEL